MRIFISYRRGDAAGHAGRLADHLAARFGSDHVFIDVASIGAGQDYVDAIGRSIADAEVTLVVIGPAWSSVADTDGRGRLWAIDDPVRIEVEASIAADARTIPVLVGGAAMPPAASLPRSLHPLLTLNAVELLDRRWAGDVSDLVDLLERPASDRTTPASPPVPASSLVGRRALLASATEAMSSARLVSLVGPGGVGKTRLAIELSSAALDAGRAAWFASLTSARGAAGTAEALLAALGVSARGDEGIDAAICVLRFHPGLLVVDNCEHVLDDAAELVARLIAGAPELGVLVTSREPLRLEGEHIVEVPPLPVPRHDLDVEEGMRLESVQLFADRAAAAGGFELTRQDLASVIEICERVAGLPLGIELAAARVRSLPLDRIVTSLASRSTHPREGRRGHHDTMATAIDWSVDLLSAAERRLFMRLSTFRAPFPIDGVEAIGGGVEAINDAAALVDKSLLVMDRSDGLVSYRFLEPIHERAETLLRQSEHAEPAAFAHAAWVADVVTAGEERLRGPEQPVWLARLADLLPDIRAAIELRPGEGRDHRVAIIGGLWWFLLNLDVEEWGPLVDGVLEAADPDDPACPLLVASSAVQRLWRIDLAGAEGLATRVLGTAPRSSLPSMIASMALGSLMRERGEHAAALARHREDERVAREARQPWWIARALYSAGLVHIAAGRPSDARDDLERAATIAREQGDPSNVLDCLDALYQVATIQGDELGAERVVEQMGAWVEGAMPEERAGAALCMSELASSRGSVDAAMELALDSIDRSMRIGPASDVSMLALERVAACLARMDRPLDAVALVAAGEAFLPMPKRFYSDTRRVSRERMLIDLRLAIGQEAFAREWGRGSRSRFEDLLGTL